MVDVAWTPLVELTWRSGVGSTLGGLDATRCLTPSASAADEIAIGCGLAVADLGPRRRVQ
jgi:hypothetical protein